MNNKTLSFFIGILSVCLSITDVHANSISTSNTVMFANQKITDIGGVNTLTLDAIGLNFTNPLDGAAFSLSWDPSVLSYTSFIADPIWDISFIDDTNSAFGSIDYIFLVKENGNVGKDFKLGSLSFNVLDFSQLAGTIIDIGKDTYDSGFSAEGAIPITTVNYLPSEVMNVPEPNQWLLIILGLSMMYFVMYCKNPTIHS